MGYYFSKILPLAFEQAVKRTTEALKKTALSVLVILPPTFLMGMTLPVMVSAVATRSAAESSREVRLYAANTLRLEQPLGEDGNQG